MTTRAPDLTLDEFMLQMNRRPGSKLTHEQLMEYAGRLRLPDELVATRTLFSHKEYARNLVCRTTAFELLVLCWRPGQATTIHDHVGALNAIRVFTGELTSRVFRTVGSAPRGTGPVEMTGEERVASGDHLVGVDRGGIHQLANTSTDELITVHVYAPALMELNVYSTESPTVERRLLRYTMADDLD